MNQHSQPLNEIKHASPTADRRKSTSRNARSGFASTVIPTHRATRLAYPDTQIQLRFAKRAAALHHFEAVTLDYLFPGNGIHREHPPEDGVAPPPLACAWTSNQTHTAYTSHSATSSLGGSTSNRRIKSQTPPSCLRTPVESQPRASLPTISGRTFLTRDVIARLAGSPDLLDWTSGPLPHHSAPQDPESNAPSDRKAAARDELARWAENAAAKLERAAKDELFAVPSNRLTAATLSTPLTHQTQDDIPGMGHERFDPAPTSGTDAPWQVKNQSRASDQQEGPRTFAQPD